MTFRCSFETRANYPFQSFERTARRHRAKKKQKVFCVSQNRIKNLVNLGRTLIEQEGVKYKSNGKTYKIEAFSIESAQKEKESKKMVTKHHVFFCDRKFLEALGNVEDIRIDGTFKTSPSLKGVYQLITLIIVRKNTPIPIAWILMANKTKTSYKDVWKFIKENFATLSNFKTAMTDFELAMRSGLRAVFQGIKVYGCWFHYTQCLWRNAVKKGFCRIKNNKKHRPEHHFIVRQLMALALIPESGVKQQYYRIRAEAMTFFEGTAYEGNTRKFLKYYEREWLDGIYSIKEWCVFGFQERTNNFLESYHKILQEVLGLRPTSCNFIRGMISLLDSSREKLWKVKNHKITPTKKSKKTIIKAARINKTWEWFNDGRITASEAVEYLALFEEYSNFQEENDYRNALNNQFIVSPDFFSNIDSYLMRIGLIEN